MSFPFFEHWKKRNSDIWWMFPASLSNCSFLVQRNNLRNAFSTRNLFSTFFLIEWWKFGFSWVFIRIPFKSFSLRQKWSFGERFVLSKLPGIKFKKLSQNVFGFLTNIFLRNVKSVFHMSRGILRSFSWRKGASSTFVDFEQKNEAFWQKFYRQGCKVEFHVSKATVHSNLSLKEKTKFPSFSDKEQWKFRTVQQNFPTGLSNLLSEWPVE